MGANAVPGFLPSLHGFRFANRFPPGPTIRFGPLDPRRIGVGDAAAGLCGGMVLTVRDLFEHGVPAPLDAEPPPNGSRRFEALVRRQVQSLDWLRVPLRYFDLQAFRPDPPTALSRRLRRLPPRVEAVDREWPRIRADIDAGRAPVIGLVRVAGASPWALAQNHQVLGFAYHETETDLTIRIYDPNHPGRDDVLLRAHLQPEDGRPAEERVTLFQSTGEPLLGFFRQPYPVTRSVGAWR